ncbi:MAG: WG repeat-containing protein [Clostridia bacterium]|nr:WG repeat-containing protein [Clostridia bacterium]
MSNERFIYDVLGTDEGFTKIRLALSGMYNFLTQDEKLLSEESFLDAGYFEEGFAPVQRIDKRWYFLRADGTLMPKCNGFSRAWGFDDGVAFVEISKDLGFNFVNQTGTLISKENYSEAYQFSNGFARVHVKDKGWNFLKKDGTHLSETYFLDAGDFKNGVAWIKTQDMRVNLIKEDGTIIIVEETIFEKSDFSEGFANIRNETYSCNYIDTNGKVISKKWFINTYPFINGFGIVLEKKGYNYITPNGTLLCGQWFCDACYFTADGVARVKLHNGTYNFVKSDGTFLSEKWFYYASNFDDGFAMVILDGKYNYIKPDGTMLLEKWRNTPLPT